MRRIVVGVLRSPEGRAALDAAIAEAERSVDAELVVVHSLRPGDPVRARESQEELELISDELRERDLDFRVVEFARGLSPAEDLLQAAEDEAADLIVIGVRRRSPVGKLVLGSAAQDVLLRADCAVLAVKAAPDADSW